MKIETLKDLDKLIRLCRRHGVEAIECDGIRMDLGLPKQTKASKRSKATKEVATGELEPNGTIEDDSLTPEQLMYYSAVPHGDMEAN